MRNALCGARPITACAAALAIVLAGLASPSRAADSVTYLGKPVDVLSSNQYFPLSGFHKVNASLQQGGKPVVLFLGTQLGSFNSGLFAGFGDDRSAMERWALIKALDQFGSFSGVTPLTGGCLKIGGQADCRLPSFDWLRGRYSSRYVVFDHKELLDAAGHRLQRMTSQERGLYYRYARVPTVSNDVRKAAQDPSSPYHGDPPDNIYLTVTGACCNTDSPGKILPLTLIGNYLQTETQELFTSDFTTTASKGGYLSFGALQDALVHGIEPAVLGHLIADVNAEANVITALICHADGKKPASVCGRPVIKQITKSIH
jgi:hypothetical protein